MPPATTTSCSDRSKPPTKRFIGSVCPPTNKPVAPLETTGAGGPHYRRLHDPSPFEIRFLAQLHGVEDGPGRHAGRRRARASPRVCRAGACRRRSSQVLDRTSFDHLISAGEQLGRHGEAKGFRGLEINHQLNSCTLLDGEVSRLDVFENFSVDPERSYRS